MLVKKSLDILSYLAMRVPLVAIRRSLLATNTLKVSCAQRCKWYTTSNVLRAEAESSLDNLQYYARKRQTNVSLRALMETGNGKYLDGVKSGMNVLLNDASANEKILIQVRSIWLDWLNARNKIVSVTACHCHCHCSLHDLTQQWNPSHFIYMIYYHSAITNCHLPLIIAWL